MANRAGAQWRTQAGVEDEEQQRWDVETYRRWMEDVEAGDGEEESGLSVSTLVFQSQIGLEGLSPRPNPR